MASRRAQIEMTDAELRAFLGERMTMQVATVGPRGRPHLVPLWFVPDGTELVGWTYAKSQKARNLERDPHATVGIEDGVRYQELRGVMLECDVQVERDVERITEIGGALLARYYPGEVTAERQEGFRRQAPKRVGLRFVPTRIVSWDHRKLGGGY